MLSESHDLVHELPEHKDTIHALKTNNNHFARLFDQFDTLNKEILRIEKGVEAASDERLETMKKERLALKDEMMKMIEGFEG
ncbi:MAG: YdcH family protein [Rhodospirillales bacterium]|nr:YdcH family protein [Alphaproteobacteria bacterium]MCB1840539.1 YdcH family protein [Alphaproteobacteria bacterium]MCB9977140.1 YdcH family protein [Rhodospirillales bacterium]